MEQHERNALAAKNEALIDATASLDASAVGENGSPAEAHPDHFNDDDVPYLSPSATSVVPPATKNRLHFDNDLNYSETEADVGSSFVIA
ncbi:hypothetical protein AAVH_14442 [Aphelenchoides avenae]|nr:hypothetical protein AAVH_14442 [Aphelenchus avenae]